MGPRSPGLVFRAWARETRSLYSVRTYVLYAFPVPYYALARADLVAFFSLSVVRFR